MSQHEDEISWLASAHTLRKRVRTDSLPSWLPLLVFGCVVLGAVPLYVAASAPEPDGFSFVTGRLSFFGGWQPAWYVGLYWLLSIPTGYGLSALFYSRHTSALGVGDRSLPFTTTGLALFGALLLLYFLAESEGAGSLIPGNLLIRGLLPLLAISLALVALAVIARNISLGLFAMGFVGLTITVNLYDKENLAFRLGWTPSSDLHWRLTNYIGLIVCGIVLLLAAGVALVKWKAARGSSG